MTLTFAHKHMNLPKPIALTCSTILALPENARRKFLKPLWGGHLARPKNTNMTFMSLISEFNELTLTKIF
ncbi:MULTISPECIES: hypothetical protein [unclassified Microcoleus]|uniref:hypothetical protein n=1 Tax=unclassified Microcoleus TaxID=2642155 RepID=UPI0025EE626B|nr:MULTISPECIES: hypothetical protein [unclassified Microcoleus]